MGWHLQAAGWQSMQRAPHVHTLAAWVVQPASAAALTLLHAVLTHGQHCFLEHCAAVAAAAVAAALAADAASSDAAAVAQAFDAAGAGAAAVVAAGAVLNAVAGGAAPAGGGAGVLQADCTEQWGDPGSAALLTTSGRLACTTTIHAQSLMAKLNVTRTYVMQHIYVFMHTGQERC